VSQATTERTGVFVDNGNGTYTYQFAADLNRITDAVATTTLIGYDPTLTHRFALQVSGSVKSLAFPAMNTTLDLIPAGGTPVSKEVTRTTTCNECHGQLRIHGSRYDLKYCVVCHNAKSVVNKATGQTVDMAPMTHGIHSALMRRTATPPMPVYTIGNAAFGEVGYPQALDNCRKCHNGADALTPQGDNWKNKPTKEACGACHANLDFATHMTGGQPDNKKCANCHDAAAIEDVHKGENATPNNPVVKAGAPGKVAYNFIYDIKEATVNASNQAVVTFRILNNGTPMTLTTAGLPTDLTSGPSFLLAYALPQGGIDPIDYNNLGRTAAQPASVSVVNLDTMQADTTKRTGTLTGPDASGYYVATLTGTPAAPVSFPAGAKMRAVALQGYWSQVAYFADGTNLARHTLSVVKPVTGDAVRREIIDNTKCASCHEWFEGHGGNRNIGALSVGQNVCTVCHVPNLSTSGRGADPATVVARLLTGGSLAWDLDFDGVCDAATEDKNADTKCDVLDAMITAGYTPTDPLTFPEVTNNLKDMIHGIHGAANRTIPYREVRDRGASGVFYYDFSEVTYPNENDKCLACHKPGTYDAELPAGVLATTDKTSNGTDTFAGIAAARKSVPNTVDLVTSPTAAACYSCHNSTIATAHFQQNGGVVGLKRGLVK
jgi:OmcA/MtrC family decaheme c-type cytochrome